MIIEWKKSLDGYVANVEGKRVSLRGVQSPDKNSRYGFRKVWQVLIDGADIPCARHVTLSKAKFNGAAHAMGAQCKHCERRPT